MKLTMRDATPDDAALIAWVQVAASRSGTPLGFWDLAFPGADEPRQQLIADIARCGKPHFADLSGFIVAELDGEPVGALSGYAPTVKKLGHFVGEACAGVRGGVRAAGNRAHVARSLKH